MIKNKLNKAIIGIIGAAALASASTQASAALVAFDSGVAGTTASVTDSVSTDSWTFGFGVNLGWNHTINVHDLFVSGGAGNIQLTAKQTATTDALPGFTIWHRTSGSGFISPSHQFNQVTGPTGTNAYLTGGGVDYLVGYGNAGATFTNADGDAVGHGGVSVPGSWTYGTDGAGLAYVTLNFTGLSAGTYYIMNGGSDFNSTSGKTTGGYKLTASVSAVPVPAAVWLFGSAITGLVGVSRRKKTSIA